MPDMKGVLVDVISILNDYGIMYHVSGNNCSPGFVNISCVFCSDGSCHLGIKLDGTYANCWKCGSHNIVDVFSTLLNITEQKTKNLLYEYSGKSLVFDNKKKTNVSKIVLPGKELMEMHRRYLLRRNFDPDYLVEKYKIRGTGIVGYWKYRIIIPIYYNNQLVAYQGRDITGKQKLRYLSLSPEKSVMNIKNVLYNSNNCNKVSIIVLEGVTDVWRFGDNCVCTFGTSVTEAQVNLLSQYENIFFIFDSEKEAQQKAKKAALKLASLGCNTEVIDLQISEDPGSMNIDEVNYIKKELLL